MSEWANWAGSLLGQAERVFWAVHAGESLLFLLHLITSIMSTNFSMSYVNAFNYVLIAFIHYKLCLSTMSNYDALYLNGTIGKFI